MSFLRAQEQEKLQKLRYEKVPGQANQADLFTKEVGCEKLQQFSWASGQTFLEGRAETSLHVQGASKTQIVHEEKVVDDARSLDRGVVFGGQDWFRKNHDRAVRAYVHT